MNPTNPTDLLALGAAAGIKLESCGLNADWSCEAHHVGDGETPPNTRSGDLYVLDAEEAKFEFYLVRRAYDDDGDDTFETLVEGDAAEVIAKINESK